MPEATYSNLYDCTENLPESKDDEINVVLNDQKEGIFLCPACENSVVRDLSKVAHAKSAIRVKCNCKCGNIFRVLVERRKNIRKSVNLVGMCHFIDGSGKNKKRLIKIHDISFSGLQFSLNDIPKFRFGDQIIVDFRLDDRERNEVKEKGIVIRITSKIVGLQFASEDRCRPLKLYLMK